jgi:myo-inositol-1(or 4)-monophosphatase
MSVDVNAGAWRREEVVDLDAALTACLDAAREACVILVQGQAELTEEMITTKKPGDVTTDIDRRAEKAIRSRLQTAFPDFAFTGEEGGSSGRSRCRWIVDPLDGTMNYVHGFPFYAVSLALTVDDEIVIGVVADPLRDETFWALIGRGAFLNGRPITVSDEDSMEKALVGTVCPPPSWPGRDAYLKKFCRVASHAAGVRRAGAAALDLAYVAAGRLDAFFVESLKAWDIAAGMLLVTEAGGQVSDIFTAKPPLLTNRLAAANTHLLPQLLKLLRQEG